MKTPLQIFVSLIAGGVTYFLMAVVLAPTQATPYWWLFSRYQDVFGLASFVGHLAQTAPFSDHDEFYGPYGRAAANAVTIGFWTLVFGALYFVFVFRQRKRSNQSLQPTAGRSDE